MEPTVVAMPHSTHPVIDGDVTDTAVGVPSIIANLFAILLFIREVPLIAAREFLISRTKQSRHRPTSSVSVAVVVKRHVVYAYPLLKRPKPEPRIFGCCYIEDASVEVVYLCCPSFDRFPQRWKSSNLRCKLNLGVLP